MNPNLLQLIPGRVRLWIYLVFSLVGFALAAVPAFCGGAGYDVPAWVGGATQVFALAGAYFGVQAAANTSTERTLDDVDLEPGNDEPENPDDDVVHASDLS